MKIFNLNEKNKKILFLVYLFCNIVLFFRYYFNQELGGDLSGYGIADNLLLLSSVVLVVSSFIIFNVVFNIFDSLKVKRTLGYVRSSLIDYFCLCIIVTSCFFSLYYGYGRVGVSTESIPSFVILFNKFFVPNYFLSVYFFYKYDSKSVIYKINILLFCLNAIFQGFTFPLLMVGYLFVYRLQAENRLNIKALLVVVFAALLFSPFIRVMKNIMIRSAITGDYDFLNGLDALYTVSDVSHFYELYALYAAKVMERFESISALFYIKEHINDIRSLYESNKFLPFHLYHWIPQTIDKILNPNSVYDITQDYVQRAIAFYINPYFQWQIHITFWGWVLIDPDLSFLYMIYVFSLLSIAIFLSKKLSFAKNITNLVWYYSFLYICHGWFNEYILFIQGLFVFSIFIGLFNIQKLKRY
ncbi:oligosaccharide repeat unit polymerase [Aeromonas salmonicida]|uniref:oligosaccharide repeat unit polymerase n=1 Tax=Aeromonas salmonicida TaxID=645 RepID=UPI003D24D933